MQIAPKNNRLLSAIIILICITIFLGVLIVPIEKAYSKNPLINDLGDGLWWSVVTATGVGYGDIYPTTLAGRIIGIALATIGVANFGMIIALITVNLFRGEQQFYWRRTTERFDQLTDKLSQLEHKQDYTIVNHDKKPPSEK